MRKTILLLFVILFAINVKAQNSRDTLHTKVGHVVYVNSKHLDDNVKLFVHHPFNYKPEKEFPLIVLLDGNSTFKAFSCSAELMGYDRSIPLCIAVAFPQYKYAGFTEENFEVRMKKLSLFIEEELMPNLRSKYNISHTIIWGMGAETGLISTYMMLEKPDVFDGYIVDVPELTLISDKAYSSNAFEKLENKSVKYFLFGSSYEHEYNEKFIKNLKANAPEGLKWSYSVSDEPNMIISFLNNYMHALESFFNEKN